MSETRTPASLAPHQIAKAALTRLAESRLEPTPDNYRQAYQAVAGSSADPGGAGVLELLLQRACPALQGPDREALLRALQEGQWTQAERRLKAVPAAAGEDAVAWAELIDKTVRGVSRASKQWTTARRKDSLQRVLTGSRSDAERLQRRLSQLVSSWDGEQVPDEEPPLVVLPDAQGDATSADAQGPTIEGEAPPHAPALVPPAAGDATPAPGSVPAGVENVWPRVVATLGDTVRCALPVHEARAHALGEELSALQQRLLPDGQDAGLADALDEACGRARRLLSHRHHLTDQLGVLARELTAGLADLAEDDSWAQGQCAVMLQQLDEGLTTRSVRSVNQLLSDTRERQQQLRTERGQARDALKQAIHRMLSEIGELGTHTGRFEESIGRYADVIGQADTVESLAGIVQEMVDETRTVHGLVASAQQRLQDEHGRAAELSDRVQSLEEELRRISEEVATDPLTKIANRRGLMGAFESEVGRARRDAAPLSVGLLDIDNFKRLNDELGHNTGDAALVFLAEKVKSSLRPGDTVARWGGEEFVVLLPATQPEEAQQVLTRLQRGLSAELFMHEGRQTFVTFSAGVTLWRDGEPVEDSLQRADEALYEAKRTGKNRTCAA